MSLPAIHVYSCIAGRILLLRHAQARGSFRGPLWLRREGIRSIYEPCFHRSYTENYITLARLLFEWSIRGRPSLQIQCKCWHRPGAEVQVQSEEEMAVVHPE